MPDLHDTIYDALNDTGPIKELLVLARLADPRLMMDEGADGPVRVFIPDLHLLPPGQIGTRGNQWNYETNGVRNGHFVELLRVLKRLKADLGERLEVIVLGDLVDLWRHGRSDPTEIMNSRAEIVGAFNDDPDALEAMMLYGNHDIELSLSDVFNTVWQRRIYLPVGSSNPHCLVLHGDIFDWIERLSVPVKTFFLTLFGHRVGEDQVDLTDLRATAARGNDVLSPADWAVEQTSAATKPSAAMGDFNTRRAETPDPALTHKFLDLARKHATWAKEEFNETIRSMVIGHTHHVGIGVLDHRDDFFALFDCGAWIGNAKLHVGNETKRVPSAQIGVQFGNDFRIYQVVGKDGTELELRD